MTDKTIRKKVQEIKRQKMAQKKVISLKDFRKVKAAIEIRTILVVDDDPIIRNALKRILNAEGYKPILAEDGIELARVLETTRLDLILLDINLPWINGYELCHIVKDHHSLHAVPVILISGRKTEEDIDKGFKAGADEYVTKPFEINYILGIIQKYLTPKKTKG